jgi:hypothetical protein
VGFSPRVLAVTSSLFGPDLGSMVQDDITPKQAEIKINLLIFFHNNSHCYDLTRPILFL